MDTTPWGTPCVSEFSVNENRVTDSFDFGNGIGEANLTDTNGYFNGFEDSFQSQTSFSFTSLLQDFETDHAFAEYQEYLLNQQSNLMNHQSDMVQNRVVSCGEGDVAMGGLAPNSSMVNDHVLSPEEEKAMLEFTPTPEWEMMMEELAPYPSLVHDHGFSSHEATLEFVSPLNVVHDHVIPSTGGNMMMAEAALPPSVHGHVVSHEKENVVQNGRNLINILHPRRPRLTYCNGATSRIRWTTELHALFVSSVEELGGSDTATPERILSLMDVPGLTRFHIKSHLQKYRNGACLLVNGFDRSEPAAMPECILSLMDVPSLTHFHVKSHLQKYRNGGCLLVDVFDRSERAARRDSVSRLQKLLSNSPSSSVSPVPQGCPSSSRIVAHGNAPNRKIRRKRKAESKARS